MTLKEYVDKQPLVFGIYFRAILSNNQMYVSNMEVFEHPVPGCREYANVLVPQFMDALNTGTPYTSFHCKVRVTIHKVGTQYIRVFSVWERKDKDSLYTETIVYEEPITKQELDQDMTKEHSAPRECERREYVYNG